MAAAGVAILDNPYLGGDALAHRVGMTDDAHLLALRTLQQWRGSRVTVARVVGSRVPKFVDEQILEGDVAGRQRRQAQGETQTHDEGFAT